MPELALNKYNQINGQQPDENKKNKKMPNIFDEIEIIIDPELEDESTVDINDYLNKYILQCRICGNLFPSDIILDADNECPVCDSKSSNGYVYKGKLINNNKSEDVTEDEAEAIQELEDDEEDINEQDKKSDEEDTTDDVMSWEKDEDGNLELNIED